MTDPERTLDHAPQNGGTDAAETHAFDGAAASNQPWPTQAGRYLIGEEIARGGMGAILRAVDPEVERPIAIKVMLVQRSDEDVRRFRDETRIAAQLQHPGIAPLYDVGSLDDGRPFFAMKLIEGQTLDELLRARKDPADNLPRFLAIFEQLCQTLAYAHSRKVIHRDLKPANIMIGAFGEVQVMDWGLAKTLTDESGEDALESPNASNAEFRALDQAAESTIAVSQGEETPPLCPVTDGGLGSTRPGEMMGTPIYMPPEQARGEVHNIDERSDVFGLGGILCAILAGKAPFEAASIQRVIERAIQGDIRETCELLDACEADPDLVDLAKSCLAAERRERPQTAAAVGKAIQLHQFSVEQRLREAELRSAKAEVRAKEEAKRRRVTMVAAAAICMFLIAVIASGLWFQRMEQQRAEARRKRVVAINTAVDDATERLETLRKQVRDDQTVQVLLASPTEWQSQIDVAKLIIQKASDTIEQGGRIEPELKMRVAELAVALKEDQRDFDLAQALERVRLAKSTWRETGFDDQAAAEYGVLINASLGMSIRTDRPVDVARQISATPIKHLVIEILDDWMQAANRSGDAPLREQLASIVNLVDDDEFRRNLRAPESWLPETIREIRDELLSNEETLDALSAQSFVLIGNRLPTTDDEQITWLRLAQNRFPRDFWINFDLGNALLFEGPAEAAGSFRAAIAIRKNNSAGWTNLGIALSRQKKLEAATAALSRAVELDERNSAAWATLGLVQHTRKDPAGETSVRRALEINPRDVTAWLNLAFILASNGAIPDAIRALETAIEFDPSLAAAWSQLGALRVEAHNSYGGMYAHLTAVELDPNLAVGWLRLGNARRLQDDLTGANEAYEKAVAIDPTLADGWYNLGVYRASIGEFESAVVAMRHAVELKPDYVDAWSTMGNSLRQLDKFGPAMEALNRALELDSKHGVARVNLAMAHLNQGEFQVAVDLMGEALGDLNRNDPRRSKVYDWRYLCRRLVHFNKDLPRILAGDDANPDRLVELADLCYRYKKRYGHAVALYERAFVGKPELVGSTTTHEMHGFRAAAAAVLAADPQTTDGSLTASDEQTRLRQLALSWLKTNLESCVTLAMSDPEERSRVHSQLTSWQDDPDFRSTRDPMRAKELPSRERTVWQEFWTEYAAAVNSLEE